MYDRGEIIASIWFQYIYLLYELLPWSAGGLWLWFNFWLSIRRKLHAWISFWHKFLENILYQFLQNMARSCFTFLENIIVWFQETNLFYTKLVFVLEKILRNILVWFPIGIIFTSFSELLTTWSFQLLGLLQYVVPLKQVACHVLVKCPLGGLSIYNFYIMAAGRFSLPLWW